VVKGAPEVVLDRCVDAADGRERVERLAAEGLRVIAVADRSVAGGPDGLTALDLDEAARDLTLRGLVALADGVREVDEARGRAAAGGGRTGAGRDR
jgi:cation-transporting ATPase I